MTDEQIRLQYNSYTSEQRDMSYREFRNAIKDMQNPVKLRQDLVDIQMRKSLSTQRKNKIDRKLGEL